MINSYLDSSSRTIVVDDIEALVSNICGCASFRILVVMIKCRFLLVPMYSFGFY